VIVAIDLRPIFLMRFLSNLQSGDRYVDLFVDSIGIDLAWRSRRSTPTSAQRSRSAGASTSAVPARRIGGRALLPPLRAVVGALATDQGAARRDERRRRARRLLVRGVADLGIASWEPSATAPASECSPRRAWTERAQRADGRDRSGRADWIDPRLRDRSYAEPPFSRARRGLLAEPGAIPLVCARLPSRWRRPCPRRPRPDLCDRHVAIALAACGRSSLRTGRALASTRNARGRRRDAPDRPGSTRPRRAAVTARVRRRKTASRARSTAAACGGCGDDRCDPDRGESCDSCPTDCGTCDTCGNAVCDGGENCRSCRRLRSCVACGDATCDASEDCFLLPSDCGVCVRCGDGRAAPARPAARAPDCGRCLTCGDGPATAPRTARAARSTAAAAHAAATTRASPRGVRLVPEDCGRCETCNDGICNGLEDCSTCRWTAACAAPAAIVAVMRRAARPAARAPKTAGAANAARTASAKGRPKTASTVPRTAARASAVGRTCSAAAGETASRAWPTAVAAWAVAMARAARPRSARAAAPTAERARSAGTCAASPIASRTASTADRLRLVRAEQLLREPHVRVRLLQLRRRWRRDPVVQPLVPAAASLRRAPTRAPTSTRS